MTDMGAMVRVVQRLSYQGKGLYFFQSVRCNTPSSLLTAWFTTPINTPHANRRSPASDWQSMLSARTRPARSAYCPRYATPDLYSPTNLSR